jgi:hypothetical protein
MTGAIVLLLLAALNVGIGGCGRGQSGGYSNQWLYADNIRSIYVEMFENPTLRRGHEYGLTDAVAKRIEAETPYKIVADRNRADTLLSGRISSISEMVLTGELETGQPLEKQFMISAVVSWKDLRSGKVLIEGRSVTASASFSPFQQQRLGYAAAVATNRLAEQIVELMQKPW